MWEEGWWWVEVCWHDFVGHEDQIEGKRKNTVGLRMWGEILNGMALVLPFPFG
jgi:hypothetical protein